MSQLICKLIATVSVPPEIHEWLLHKLKHYRRKDREHHHELCDIFPRELFKLFQQPCFYCGENDIKQKTLDRINHHKGHVKGNVIVACIACNTERNDKVSMERFLAFNLMYQIALAQEKENP